MFNNFSWSSYLLIIGTITAVYYFLIAMIYCRNEITKIIFSRNSDFINTTGNEGNRSTIINSDNDLEDIKQKHNNEKEDVILSSMVHELSNDLNKLFKKASDKKFVKEELMMALHLTLKNYMRLKESAFRGAINSLIELESQSQCSIYLNESEVELLWNGG